MPSPFFPYSTVLSKLLAPIFPAKNFVGSQREKVILVHPVPVNTESALQPELFRMLLDSQENFIPSCVKREPKRTKLALLNAALMEEQRILGDSATAKLSDVVRRELYAKGTIYEWKRGAARPSLEAYFRFAKHYGWSKSYALKLAEKDRII